MFPVSRLSRSSVRSWGIDGIIEQRNLTERTSLAANASNKALHKNNLLRREHFCSGRGDPKSGIRRGGINSPSAICIFPFALLLRRRDRRKYEQRLVKIAIYVLTGVAVLGSNTLQNRIADRRAIAIGNACLAYRAKYHQYPAELKDLVPEFLPSVPVAKWSGEHFSYSRALDPDREPMLYYAAVPPFGRRFYHMESGGWGYLD
jgi:hypothetical protein